MALLDLNIRELCDWRTRTFNAAGYQTVLAADPAVTVPLLAKMDAGQYKHTPYWRVCVAEAAKLNHYRCSRCGGWAAVKNATMLVPDDVVRGTEHVNMHRIKVEHKNHFYCETVEKNRKPND